MFMNGSLRLSSYLSVKSNNTTPIPNLKIMSPRSDASTKSVVSNDDIMPSVNEFKFEIINSNKINSDLQTKQFKNFKSELKFIFN